MKRFTKFVATSILAMAIVVLNARSAQKQQGSSKPTRPVLSDGKNQSKGNQSGKSNDKGKDKDSGKKGPEKTISGKVARIDTAHPKNPGKPGDKSAPAKPAFLPLMKKVGSNPNVGNGAKSAINTLDSGNFLSVNQRQDLTDLLAGNPAGLSEDELKAVQAALNYDAQAKREERYLELDNATGERLTVWLHYQTFNEDQNLSWYPTKPVDVEKAMRYVLEPNTKLKLGDGNTQIAAARARVWAESDSGYKWLTYRDSDLRLKPERPDSKEMGTYPLKLVGVQTKSAQASK